MWTGSTAIHFIGMWATMMAVMMLPSLVPMLWRYRTVLAKSNGITPLSGIFVALAAAAYFAVWAATGVVVFPLGAALSSLLMTSPSLSTLVPTATGVVLIIAGLLQFTRWKRRQLARCGQMPDAGFVLPPTPGNALLHGLRLGSRCAKCCAPLTAMLLVLGAMDMRYMAVMTLATTLERLPHIGVRSARLIGAAAVLSALLCVRV